jgi:hypothetical protein
MPAAPGKLFHGSCHCRNLRFAFRTGVDPARWPMRACQCTFCRRHGAISTSDPAGSVEFEIARPEDLIRYRFGKQTADFLICASCGIYVAACMDSPRGRFAVINANTLDPLPAGLPPAAPMDYEAEATTARTARREQRWTPVIGTI